MKSVKPKKFLGQHFLKDMDIARRIADTVDVVPDIPILEVGPGMGELTQYLVPKGRELKVVEVDFESISYLNHTFPKLGENIIEEDFLQMDLNKLFEGRPFVLTGNYPYNISSQKEVAERIASEPGHKAYGIISVLIQAWYKVEYLFTVEPNVFNPPPKVKSAVIRMTRNDTNALQCDERLFKQVVKTTFNQRRKTLRNSIRPLLGEHRELTDQPLFNRRPEQLSVEEFVNLTNMVGAVL
jgi:16S rRNA (adenine1518-N6/adenine1519-N6)-dimethyltransferase